MYSMYLPLAIVVCTIAGTPVTALAFDPKTHVWVGQQVLNDVLDDAHVTIEGFEYAVDPKIVDALKRHPSAYRMGHIGPDAHPDLVVGQSYIHPGDESSGVDPEWATDDWMRWVQDQAGDSSEALAYAYGFWGHAAGDVIAHTYVNMYAGDFFDLLDKEAEVELRHFTLEHYIGDRTPGLQQGERRLGPAHDPAVVRAPSVFIAQSLILNPTVCEQYSKKLAGAHLIAMFKVKEVVDQLAAESKELTRTTNERLQQVLDAFDEPQRVEGEAAGRIERLQGQIEAIKGRLPDLADAERAAKQAFDRIDAAAAGAQQVLAAAETAEADARSKVESLTQEVENALPQQIARTQKALDTANEEVADYDEQISELKSNIEDEQGRVGDLDDEVDDLSDKLDGLVRTIRGPFGTRTDHLPGYSRVKRAKEAAKRKLDRAKDALEEFQGELKTAKEKLDKWKDRVKNRTAEHAEFVERKAKAEIELAAAKDAFATAAQALEAARANPGPANESLSAAREVFQQAKQAHSEASDTLSKLEDDLAQAQESLEQAREAIRGHSKDLRTLQETFEPASDLSAFFERWSKDIDRATNKYVEAATQALLNTMKPEPRLTPLGTQEEAADPKKPLMDWLYCYGPVFTGVPYEAGRTVCEVRSRYREAVTKVDAVLARAPLVESLLVTREKLKEELIGAGVALAEKSIGEQYTQFYSLHGRAVTPEELNSVFQRDESGKNLVEFSNIVKIINRDLGLESSSAELRLETCPLLRHAVNMVSLTLLGPDALNSMAKNYRLPDGTVYGSTLYPTDSAGFVNVLYRAVANIDGNHQWRGRGLPYPRGGDTALKCGKEFGYCRPKTKREDQAATENPAANDDGVDDEKDYGFRLWIDPGYRGSVFAAIFPGDPAMGIKGLLPADYDERFNDECQCKEDSSDDESTDEREQPGPTAEDLAQLALARDEVEERLDASVFETFGGLGRWPRDLAAAYAEARAKNRPLVIVVEDSQDPNRQLGPVQYADSRLHNELLAPYERCLIDVSTEEGKARAGKLEVPCVFVVNPHTRATIAFRRGPLEAVAWAQLLLPRASSPVPTASSAGPCRCGYVDD